MYWHIDTDIVALIVMLSLYIYSRRSRESTGEGERRRSLLWCYRIGMVITVIDILASIVMEVPVSRFIYHTAMTLYYLSLEEGIICWLYYAIAILYHDDVRRRRHVSVIVAAPYLVYAGMVLTNPWSGIIYTLGPNNEYARGRLFFLLVVVFTLYTLMMFVMIILRRKNVYPGYSVRVLIMVPVVLSLGITVQLLNPGWLMLLPAYMICLVICFLFLQDKRRREEETLVSALSQAAMTDGLTGLWNRAGAMALISRAEAESPGKGCVMVMVDLDDLKLINDNLGHAEGDRALKAIADTLKAHFRAMDVVARVGGDEFLAYLISNQGEAAIGRSMQRLVEKISELRVGEGGDYAVHASAGAVISVVGEQRSEELYRRADTALYHIKRSGKNGYAIYTSEMDKEVRGGRLLHDITALEQR